jgi:nucleoside-diphosphate-sugar epimerase
MNSTDVIAVTGANGFIGSALCRDLTARGATVRPLARPAFDLARPAVGDGVRAVVHCAHDFTDPPLNIDGTLRLLDACVGSGVVQFVFISSLAAHAGAESTYGRTKWELECRLAAVTGLTVTILKPGTVLGPGGLFARVRRVARLPVLPVFFGGGRLQTVLIDDLCAAVAAAIERRLAGTYVVAEPSGVPLVEFYRAVAAMDGRHPWLARLNGNLALPLARLAERAGLHLPVTADSLLGLKHLVHFDTAASRAALGVEPRDFHASMRALAGTCS